jgi:hypothetical protein
MWEFFQFVNNVYSIFMEPNENFMSSANIHKMYWYIYDSYFYVFFHNDVIKWKKKNKNAKDKRPIVAQLAQQFLAVHSWSMALISLPLYIICSIPQTLTLAPPLIHSPQAATPSSLPHPLQRPPPLPPLPSAAPTLSSHWCPLGPHRDAAVRGCWRRSSSRFAVEAEAEAEAVLPICCRGKRASNPTSWLAPPCSLQVRGRRRGEQRRRPPTSAPRTAGSSQQLHRPPFPADASPCTTRSPQAP